MRLRRIRTLALLGVMFVLALVSACTCSHAAAVVNDTDSLLFANLSYDWRGRRLELEGVLVPPRTSTELSRTGSMFLRVRDMSGDTVALEHLTEGEDTRLVVSALEPLADPEPMGIPDSVWGEGLSAGWSAIICRDGQEKKVPLYGTTVTVRSAYDGPLIVSGIEPTSDYEEEWQMRGVLVPPLGVAFLHLGIVERVWLRAFDEQERLVFTQPVPREPRPVVTIPSSLPAQPEAIPTLDFSRRIGLGTDCSPIPSTTTIIIGVAIAVAVILFATGIAAFVWRRRPRTG